MFQMEVVNVREIGILCYAYVCPPSCMSRNIGAMFDRCKLKLNLSDNMWCRYPVPKSTEINSALSQMQYATVLVYLPSMQVVPSLNPHT